MAEYNFKEDWLPMLEVFLKNTISQTVFDVTENADAIYFPSNFTTDKVVESIGAHSGLSVNRQDLFIELQDRGYHYEYVNGGIKWIAYKIIEFT